MLPLIEMEVNDYRQKGRMIIINRGKVNTEIISAMDQTMKLLAGSQIGSPLSTA